MPSESVPRVLVLGSGASEVRSLLRGELGDSLLAAADSAPDGATPDHDLLVWCGGPPFEVSPRDLGAWPTPVVAVTSETTEDATVSLLGEGADEVVSRAVDDGVFAAELGAALRRSAARSDGRRRNGSRERSVPSALTALLHDARLLALLTDAEGRIRYVNPHWCASTGHEATEALGQTPRILKSGKMSDEDYARLWGRIRAGKVWHGNLVNRRADGSEYAEQAVITPVTVDGVRHFLQLGIDVTPAVGKVAVLERSRRFQTLGRAIGGIAHEFNNTFGVILSNLELLGGEDPEPPVRDALRAIDDGRATVRRLLMYTGRWRVRPEPTDLRDFIAAFVQRSGDGANGSPRLELEGAGERALASVDREGLAEVLAQLGASAGSESTEAVVVRIGVSTRDVGPAFTEGRPWAKEGAFASIRLTNHGPGWWSEREDALWDLFERDRLRGGVRGLALPMAYGFVKQHGGFVLAEPVGDTGARVELFFPLLPGDVRFDRAEHSERVDRSRRGQMVLYCEDNERLRRAGVRILEKAGYRVREAGNGREAVEILEGDDNGVDLVLSDLVMPQMDGAALHRYVSAMVCPPAFLFTTGHADARGAELPQGVPYVLKPWRREEIVAAVGRALSGAETVPVNSSGDGTVDDT